MTRSPRVDSVCRFFPETSSNLHRPARLALAIGFSLAISCTAALAQNAAKGSPDHIKAVTSAVDGASIKANTATSNDWPTIGLDYAETRFSRLNQINTDNVKKLGLVWSYPLESSRGVEATPVVVDGIMYQTASWSVVHAIDARTGKKLWSFDPGIDKEKGYKGCCDVVNRGVALWKGKVFVGAYDGRLIALDAVTGRKVWEKDTLIDKEHSYTITGAPRVFNGKVVIGNGGAEYGARGYVTAYDSETGVGYHHLRSRAEPALCRYRQRLAVEPGYPQPRRRRQPLSGVAGGAERRHRKICLALSGNPRRSLGLHLDATDDPGRHQYRRRATESHSARAEERLLLCRRPHRRQVHLGQELRRCELGHRLRRQWTADRSAGGARERLV
jgi:hypothetical protein